MKKIEKYQKYLFLILVLLGIAVRIYEFPTAIREMNSDEIMTAVNAVSIAQTGKDIGGISFPVYLQGWGGQSVILLYLMVISVKILGNTLLAVRLPMLIVSILGMIICYDLTKRITKNKTIGLIALGLVAISPWHILQSIWSLDCNMFPHFFLFATDIFVIALQKKKKAILCLSMIFYAVSLYGYGLAIYFVPLFLLAIATYLYRTKQITLKQILICGAIFILISIPLVTMFAINGFHIQESIQIGPITIPYYDSLSRTKDMLFFSENFLEQLGENIASTIKLLVKQEDGGEWNTPKPFGTIGYITMIFSLIGIVVEWKNRKKEEDIDKKTGTFLLQIWLLLSIVIGIVINEANVNRLNIIWYPLMMIAAIGMYRIYEKIKYKKTYITCLLTFYILLFVCFIIYFYGTYTQVVENSGCFSRGFYRALQYAEGEEETQVLYDNIKNDGCLALYIRFRNDTSKQYQEIREEEDLKEKIQHLEENQLLIVDTEFKQYDGLERGEKIGDFVVIKGEE